MTSQNSTTHTPGPWEYTHNSNSAAEFVEVTAANGDEIAHVYDSRMDDGEANARLMATAPRLLEALEDMTIIVGEMLADALLDPVEDLEKRHELAVAAIAAAEGSTQ